MRIVMNHIPYHSAMRDDDASNPVSHGTSGDIQAETVTSIMDHLGEVRSGVQELNTRIRSLQQENGGLRSELQQIQHSNGAGWSSDARERASRREIRLLERTIVDLKAARERDKRTIRKLRETEVRRDAEELADDCNGDASTLQVEDLGGNAIKLMRRMCDTIDMNSLAEGEECAVCMEEMTVEKCYSLPCRHPVCVECFKQLLSSSPNTALDYQTESVQCPHCREICPREECETITHTAVQQWDLLLDISRQWAAMDIGEMAVGEEENSFIDDGSVTGTERSGKSPQEIPSSERLFSLCSPETLADPGPDNSVVSTSPNDTNSVAYKSLPSPLKRKRLNELIARRTVKQRVWSVNC